MRFSLLPKQPQYLAVIRQFFVAISASLPFAVSAASIAWPSPTLPLLLSGQAPLSLTVAEASWVVSLMYVGSLASPLPAGYLANRFGRKTTLLYTGLIPVITWLLVLFSTGPLGLFVARFLMGVQYGITSTVQPLYIGEVSQADVRATLVTVANTSFNTGTLLVCVVGPFVSYNTLAVVSLIIPLLFILSFPFMPESPYYCVMMGNTDDARENLFWLRGDLNRIELELELDQIEKSVENQMSNPGSFKEIFATKGSRKAIAISMILAAVSRLSGYGVIQAYGTVTLPQRTFGVLSPDDCILIFSVTNMLASFFAVALADRFGRKTLLVFSCSGCGISMLVAALWFYLQSIRVNLTTTNFIPFITYLCQTLSFNLALGPSTMTVKSELFPANIKTQSSALASMMLGVVGFFLNKGYLMLAESPGVFLNYLIFGISCFLGVGFVILYVPETKGKTLQEIQDILSGNQQPTSQLTQTF